MVSPPSERLEQTTLLIPETLFFELGDQLYSQYSSIYVSKVLLHSLRNSTQCSDNIWDNFYTLHLPQLLFSFQKHKFSVLMWFLIHSDFFGMRYQNHSDSTGQRDRSRWERELQFFFVFIINNKLYFIFCSCAVRFAVVFRGIFRLKFLHYVSGFQSVHTNHFIAACSVQISGDPFRLHYSFLRFGFYRFYTVGVLSRP